MKRPSPPGTRTILLVHHSHTDVGYTERQGRIAMWHADFIRQALRACSEAEDGGPESAGGFAWVCETFWAVERFLERATAEEAADFAAAVRAGRIGLSASYLNMSELLDEETLKAVTSRAAAYGDSIGVSVDSAMTADINGYGWGFAQALHDAGAANLLSCVHTHHGMYPLGETQTPFWWETPGGDRILVWSGEHYHFGNELGLVPGAVSSYLIKDECDADAIHGDHRCVAEKRIPRYLDGLRERGYALPFVPVMASGLRTDNAPPNREIVDVVRWWNAEHGDVCTIEMTTLSDLFRRVRESGVDIPSHRGDWPDWWSDGTASRPGATRVFRQAQRDLRTLRALVRTRPEVRERRGVCGPPRDLAEVETELALYAEHTFGHACSVSAPWDRLAREISLRKGGYAARAQELVSDWTDEALAAFGAVALRAGAPLSYSVVNPFDRPVRAVARLRVGHHEFRELGLDGGADVLDGASGAALPSQLVLTPAGGEYAVPLTLPAGSETRLRIVPRSPGAPDGPREGVPPSADERWVSAPGARATLETAHVAIEWRQGEGIVSWRDVVFGRDLVRTDREHPPFSLVHEITPVSERSRMCAVRGEMLLNRKGAHAVRSVAALTAFRSLGSGPVYASCELEYECPGTSMCVVSIDARVDAPAVDVTLRLHKHSSWEPENLYLPLPFAPRGDDVSMVLAKAGALVRPWKDQLPGTLTDFQCVQDGFAVASRGGGGTGGYGVAVATPDSPLLQLGPLGHGPRRLAGDPELEGLTPCAYAWLATNYWETNFEPEIGGFHEFRYTITWGAELATHEGCLLALRDAGTTIPCFRTGEA
ncbi:MAG: glycoside hydrolase [Candidatus Eisenbacteria bacterium]